MILKGFVLAAALAAAGGAFAQTAPPACAAMDKSLPPGLIGWATKGQVLAAKEAAGVAEARLALGRAWRLSLRATPHVTYPMPPEKPGGATTYGGLAQFRIVEGGNYRVSLSSGAWIDVVRDGAGMASIAHGHGPACSTIHKMVDFTLAPGNYILQISGAFDRSAEVMVTPAS